MGNFTRATLATITFAVVLLMTHSHSRKPKNLEQKTGTIMRISEPRDINLPLNHIDPNKLQAYKTSYDAPLLTDSIGKISSAYLGYFKDGDFIVPRKGNKEAYQARHIQKPEDIFNSGHPYIPNYYWEISIKKPKEKRNIDYVKKFSKGLIISGMPFFPVLNLETHSVFTSIDIALTWNTGINGTYKDLDSDSENPESYLHYVQNILQLRKP